jgi:hypothetical protein
MIGVGSKLVSFLVLSSVLSDQAIACGPAPNGSNVHARLLVDGAYGIYLTTLQSAVSFEPVRSSQRKPISSLKDAVENIRLESQRSVIYSFDVFESIKGDSLTKLEVELPLRDIEPNDSDFFGHNVDEFWSDPSFGRAQITSDCSISTSFEFGHTYLIILSDVPTVKSFERIKSREDRLLRLARELAE